MKKKNIVMIMADQLRKDFLGCYGNPYVRTPNIDEIAAGSVKFDQCFVNNPICAPSRMSIFTGRYPHSHGMWTNGLMLPYTLPTLADTLCENGYHTCSIGKLHFEPTDCGDAAPMGSHEDHRYWKQAGDEIDWYGPYWGFEHVELTCGHSTAPIAHYGKWFHEHGGTDDMSKAVKTPPFEYCGVTSMPEKLHDSIFIGERSSDYIREHANDDDPYFLLVSFPDPHHPFNPPYETAMRYRDTPVKMPVNEQDDLKTRPAHYIQQKQGIWHRAGLTKAVPDMTEEEKARIPDTLEMIASFMDAGILSGLGLVSAGSDEENPEDSFTCADERNERIRNTYAMIDLIDQGVGMVLEALKSTGTLEDTIIVFTADHGELMGDHGVWYKGPFFYDGLINVPLLFRVPGQEAGMNELLASSIDIYPTLCDLIGIDIPRTCEGLSQRPALNGVEVRDHCMIEYRNGYFENDVYSVGYVDENYKFIIYQNGELELTDRQNDPEENINLAADPAWAGVVAAYKEKVLMEFLNTATRFPEQICHA